ncbi:MAG: protein jag [Elusimicrobia bacterium]|nr:protein jag [Elusimicrobiota bacterium]
MAEIEVEGKTVEEAIQEGLKKLGCNREDVEIKILNEGSNGLFGLMGNKPAVVQLKSKLETDLVDYDLAQKKTKEILSELLNLMKINYKQINTALMTGRVLADIKSDESGIIIGRGGQTLDAIELVLNLILNKDKNTRTKVSVDTDKFHLKHEEQIQKLAKDAADQVRKTGSIYHFGPMPSKDRKTIHEFLKSDNDVETYSEGEGLLRKLCIKLKDNSNQ